MRQSVILITTRYDNRHIVKFLKADYIAGMKEEHDLSARLKAVINSAIDGIITINSNGVVESINPAGADLFMYRPEEVIGRNISILMPKKYAEHHDEYIEKYQHTRKANIIGIGRQVSGLRKNGEEFPFNLAVSEVILNDRVIYTGIVHDLSDIQKAEEKLKKVNKELENKVYQRTSELEEVVNKLLSTNRSLSQEIEERERITRELQNRELELQESLEKEKELNELKSRFVSMASHEFRTPLTSISSSAAIIAKYTLEDQQSKRMKHVDRIKSAVSNLTGILNDFLSLSKLEEGKVLLNVESFDLNALFDETIEDLSNLMKGEQTIDLISPPSTEIKTDKRILKNILFNLLSNAVKYSDKRITLKVEQAEKSFTLHIIDQGIGIPEQDQKHLFSRFYRASNASNIQGTGLGLNIVKRYVELLQGEIKYDTKEGEGTTFSVQLPTEI